MVMKQLHPGVKWSFRINGFFGVLFLLIFFGVWIGIALFEAFGEKITGSFLFLGFFCFILLLVLIEVYARLTYQFWKYEFLEDQLRMERGIIWKKYSNIPYSRVQNVDITRGIVARICGFSSVNIQTAGYSAPVNNSGRSTEGYIPAVAAEEAEKIREFLMKKLSKKKSSGL